jgi:hypothetical protein
MEGAWEVGSEVGEVVRGDEEVPVRELVRSPVRSRARQDDAPNEGMPAE